MVWSRAFQKCIFSYHIIFWTFFCKFAICLQILKEKHICHIWTSTIGFKGGGGKIDPLPMHILVFNYPSMDRVKT